MKKFRYLLSSAVMALLVISLLLNFPAAVLASTPQEDTGSAFNEADSIVLGTVVNSTSAWNAEHTSIVTSVEIAVEDSFKGIVDSQNITVTVPGGEVNGITQYVSDTPVFLPGERMIAYLKHPAFNHYEPYFSFNSKMSVINDQVAGSGLTLSTFKSMVNSFELDDLDELGNYLSTEAAVSTPTISVISPAGASSGTGSVVIITGSGFGSTIGSVHFYYRSGVTIAGTVKAWSDTSIGVEVPVGTVSGYPASAGSGPVYVKTAAGAVSNYYNFAVTFSYGGAKWPGTNPVVNYAINPNTSDTAGEDTAIRNAAASWNTAANGSFSFNYVGTTTATTYNYNGVNEISWTNLGSNGVLGLAAYWYSGGNMLEADIVFNDYYAWSSSSSAVPGYFDVESTAVHELGHWLNLRDLYGNVSGYSTDTAKVMYGVGSTGVAKRSLSAADIAGIRYIYGTGTTTTAVTLTSPNGGESWETGSSHAVNWTSSGSPGTYLKIDLYKGSSLLQTLSSAYSLSSGSYTWNIPSTLSAGTDYRVKITSTSNSSYTDISAAYFTITQPVTPTITLTSPNGGESWQAGTTRTIAWTYTGSPGSYVKLELYKGGILNQVINSSRSIGSSGAGSYSWTLPTTLTAASDYQIKITSTSNSTCTDISANTFSISAAAVPEITVTAPNGGESWQTGGVYSIAWTYSGNPGTYIKIELYKGGALYQTVQSARAIGSSGYGSYNWTIPTTLAIGSDYQIKVTSTSNAYCTDISDSFFSLAAAPATGIVLTSPNGGETWTAGTAYTIAWTYSGNPGSYVKLELYQGGVRNKVISSSRSIGKNGVGSYSWTVPSTITSGTDYSVKITSTVNSLYTDTSDADFAIEGVPPPQITINSPDGGESYQAGSTLPITWTYQGSPGNYVRIDLYKGTSRYKSLSTSYTIGRSGSGSYAWTIPTSIPEGTDYTIRVTSTSNSSCYDSSDAAFTIEPAPAPEITLVTPNGGETWEAGSAYPIEWTYVGTPGNYVRLELYKGATRYKIITSSRSIGKSGAGSYTWTVPSTMESGTDYSVKITSTTNASYTDSSESAFTIEGVPPPEINLVSPDGGETWQAGSAYTIEWTYEGSPGNYIRLELYKGDTRYKVITTSRAIGKYGAGSYTWTIPTNYASGNDYRIKITSTSKAIYTDISSGDFTIEPPPPPEITLVNPNGGETWEAGTSYTIEWAYAGTPGNYIRLELYKGDTRYKVIASSRAIGKSGYGYYAWKVPTNIETGEDYAIKITSTSTASCTDSSESPFNIEGVPPPEINLVNPNGGETWEAGTAYTIEWTYAGTPGNYVRLELYKGDTRNRVISTGRSIGRYGTGSYTWTMPTSVETGTDYSIKITSTSNSTCTDTSDSEFEVEGPPTPEFSLNSPQEGITWEAGQSYTINWSYVGSPGSYVRLELYKGGVKSAVISSKRPVGSGGAGSYNWTVPSATVSGSDYQIKITSTTNSSYIAYSAEYFTIEGVAAPELSLTAPNGGEVFSLGSYLTISWNYSGKPGNYIKIELLRGNTRNRVIYSSKSIGRNGEGSYNWRIPSTLAEGDFYRVRITSTSNSQYTDVSDECFTIVKT